MESPKHIETIEQYNRMLGVEHQHPLISVIDMKDAVPLRHARLTLGFYALFLKDSELCELMYGRQRYDYQKGTVVCVAPGQVLGIEDNGKEFQPEGWGLLFHPDLIKGTALSAHIKEYHYFAYESNEALHLSAEEREIFIDCLHKIRHEITGANDRMTRRLLATNIQLVLDYCLRFYERQFSTRQTVNSSILAKFETLLTNYFASPRLRSEGVPTVKWCADELCLSANYFGDLIKRETGRSAKEHIQFRLIDMSKELVLDPSRSISQVAYDLGFQYPQHLTRMFKKVTGLTPHEFRLEQDRSTNA